MPRDQKQRDLVKCEDMRLFAERAIRYVADMSLEAFASDEIVQDAVVYSVSVIGEAARRVSTETQSSHTSIPWSEIIGMRHVLIHDYARVDAARVYEDVKIDLPALLEQLAVLIPRLESEVGWADDD
jgi:uncharacterized protein with HEPN domain